MTARSTESGRRGARSQGFEEGPGRRRSLSAPRLTLIIARRRGLFLRESRRRENRSYLAQGYAAALTSPDSPLSTITSSTLLRIRCLKAVTGLSNSIRVAKSAGNEGDTWHRRRNASPR